MVSESIAQQTCSNQVNSPPVSFVLGYDKAGNVTADSQHVSGYSSADNGTWSFSYDAANRMSTATDPASVATSTLYDGAGNQCWNVQAAMPTNPTCGTVPSGGTSYSYDQSGYLKNSAKGGVTTTYATNALGELTGVTVGSGNPSTYSYDPWGHQVTAVIPSGSQGAGTYQYGWDPLGRMLTDTKQGGSTTSYAYAGVSFDPASVAVGSSTTLFAQSPSGPLAQKTGASSAQYLIANMHGDIVASAAQGSNGLTSGNVAAYDPWGNPRGGYASGWSAVGFQGDPTDANTGQVNMQHRLYTPSLGRFTTKDSVFGSLLSPGSLNQFAYGGDNPITNSDPTGNVWATADSQAGPCGYQCQVNGDPRIFTYPPSDCHYCDGSQTATVYTFNFTPTPGAGIVEGGLYIPKRRLIPPWYTPPIGNNPDLLGDGFQSGANARVIRPNDYRVFMFFNLNTGAGRIQVNPSCSAGTIQCRSALTSPYPNDLLAQAFGRKIALDWAVRNSWSGPAIIGSSFNVHGEIDINPQSSAPPGLLDVRWHKTGWPALALWQTGAVGMAPGTTRMVAFDGGNPTTSSVPFHNWFGDGDHESYNWNYPGWGGSPR